MVAEGYNSRRVEERLAGAGFPFGDHAAQVQWANDALANGLIERTAQAEQLARGRSIDAIASTTGIDRLRVFHHLSRWPGAITSPYDEWRLIDGPEEVIEDEAGAAA